MYGFRFIFSLRDSENDLYYEVLGNMAINKLKRLKPQNKFPSKQLWYIGLRSALHW